MDIKKIASIIFTLYGGCAFSGSLGDSCQPSHLTTPCQRYLDFGAHALYLHPNSLNTYVSPQVVNTTTATSNFFGRYITPNWSWGFDVVGTYHFNQGQDFNLDWSRIHTTSTQNLLSYRFNYSGAALTSLSQNSNFNSATSTQWDAVNIAFGQRVDFNELTSARLHAGAQYARVVLKRISSLPSSTAKNIDFQTSSSSSFYNGFGPSVGLDLSRQLKNLSTKLDGLTIHVKSSASMLIGTLSTQASSFTNYVSGSNKGLSGTGNIQINQSQVVPVMEAKLEASYTRTLSQKGSMIVNIGWMWDTYFNAYQSSSASYVQNSVGTYSYSSSVSIPVNFSLQGLYFGAHWLGEF